MHLSSVNNFYVIFQGLSHCSFVILLTLHSLFLHYFCLIFFTVERVFSIWPTFSFPRCLLLPHSYTAHSETSEHKFMSISGTDSQFIFSHQYRFNQCYQLNRITIFPCQSGIQMEVFPSEQQSIVLIPFCHIPLLHTSSHHKMYKRKWKSI